MSKKIKLNKSARKLKKEFPEIEDEFIEAFEKMLVSVPMMIEYLLRRIDKKNNYVVQYSDGAELSYTKADGLNPIKMRDNTIDELIKDCRKLNEENKQLKEDLQWYKDNEGNERC